ncbi:competence protein ComEA [Kitasatospora sp. MAP12-15]|uniref:ComEA family DNA-binding protein n=1 Tax=unclassified Kitasatospora TaxID=2633591 RepID=UPI002474DAF9|nr:ComEA family DNA-binding protein [Kitasatospora sp. MAP12-44]MDH6110477.1 competence protein ComEA [Kitasatospora sp. MAP12-44]
MGTTRSSLNPALARRRETTEVFRHRMTHLFAVADQDHLVAAAPAPASAETHPAAPSSRVLPEDWPNGYGRRRDRRRSAQAPVPPDPAAPDPVPPGPVTAAPVDVGPDDVAALPRLPPPSSPLADTRAADGLSPPSDPSSPPGAHRSFRPRLPAALHSLRWVDRKAVLGLSVLLLIAVAYAVQHFWFGRPQAVAVPVASITAAGSPGPAGGPAAAAAAVARGAGAVPASAPGAAVEGAADAVGAPVAAVVVDVAGRVADPGVRSLPGGSRVADAIRAAGGAQSGVNTDELNLARVLVDGEQILVGAPSPPPGQAATPARRAPISLNRATVEQLDALPGVGPVLAQHIIDFRGSHAGFRSLDQLRQISGIGERKLAELKPLLTL